jgi:hypothetical protein
MRGPKLGPTKAASPVPISSLAQSISRMSEFAQNCRWTPDYGISSKHAAHSAHWFSPPAGTTRIAAIVRSASPHLRQIIRSPAWPARAQYSAIEAGSSISSTRIKLRSVSKQPPSQSPPEMPWRLVTASENCPRARRVARRRGIRRLFRRLSHQLSMMPNRFLQFGNSHDQLPSLANHEIFALQAGQMLGGSRPRGPNQIGDILMAERYS